jgi:hypothetical protein
VLSGDDWPLSRSKTISLWKTEVIRCAIVMTVDPENCCRSVFWIRLSVAVSTEAVASSRTSILVRLRITRPRQTSWRWLTLQFSPFSITARGVLDFRIFTRLRILECELVWFQ